MKHADGCDLPIKLFFLCTSAKMHNKHIILELCINLGSENLIFYLAIAANKNTTAGHILDMPFIHIMITKSMINLNLVLGVLKI